MVASHLRAIFRSVAGCPLDKMVEAANRVFCQSARAEQFATLAAGCLAQDGSVDFITAGTCRSCVYRAPASGRKALPKGVSAQPCAGLVNLSYGQDLTWSGRDLHPRSGQNRNAGAMLRMGIHSVGSRPRASAELAV
jgi:hypothetical protein